jgi:hypothetical protein
MKTKKITVKLTLNKSTVAVLGQEQQSAVKGGYLRTNLFLGCNTWNPICPTKPAGPCPIQTN